MTRRAAVLKALFTATPCEDSTEQGRACRYCETDAVLAALAVEDSSVEAVMQAVCTHQYPLPGMPGEDRCALCGVAE